MSDRKDLRLVSDRRRAPRGGRRPGDLAGFTPLILLIDEDAQSRELSTLELLKLRFAVAPFATAQSALAVLPSLAPDAVVVGPQSLDSVASAAALSRVPVVPMNAHGEQLIHALRLALRTRVVH
jgi:hypothetical protein